ASDPLGFSFLGPTTSTPPLNVSNLIPPPTGEDSGENSYGGDDCSMGLVWIGILRVGREEWPVSTFVRKMGGDEHGARSAAGSDVHATRSADTPGAGHQPGGHGSARGTRPS